MPEPGPPELPDLPVAEALPDLRDALADDRRCLLVAPPGAGKTTLVPLALLDELWLDGRRIVVLEPRRLAARAAARRMASLLGEETGDTVGYQTRDERRIGPGTRIEVVTEGILTRRLQSDPELPGVGLVVFDEIHERNLPTDLGLALTLDVIANLRPDLRLLAMSATPDVAALSKVLDRAPVVESLGRTFPVDLRWLPRERRQRIEDATAAAVQQALREESGDLLVFLPGSARSTGRRSGSTARSGPMSMSTRSRAPSRSRSRTPHSPPRHPDGDAWCSPPISPRPR